MKKIELEGFESQQIEVKPAICFANMKLLVNGQPVEQGPRWGQMLLRKDDGTEIIATWKPTMVGLDLPKLDVGGQVIEIEKPIKWYEMLWSIAPTLLVFGGLIGGAIGLVGFELNTRIFRSELNIVIKFLLTTGVSVAFVIGYVILIILFRAVKSGL